MNQRVGNIDTVLKDFRTETKTALQIIQTGQQGAREEMTQRFKETKSDLQVLKKDIEFTYQKTAMLELKFNRLESGLTE
ncbi:hypothetical protein AB1K83_00515 [Sporosarcina sp. 179-K 3D1 HS]|uniref:hypothetical protein n=1 Tax=Sporosarcina sp. 179-K 3D1 HS TaxID=3232169 RepID=UPI0039A2F01B